ncbi:MAG: hypothetical protein KGJ02_02020 [Verrucomicrobiota bacterium]|nr:hypothetical protein [Verrucomicrobiota bacterium]
MTLLPPVHSYGINPVNAFSRSPMEDLYPREVIDALGGVEALEKLEESNLFPDYAANLQHCRYAFKGNERIQIIDIPQGPLITRGRDQSSRPFLEVCLPGYVPLVYYTYTTCETAADFTNIRKWEIGTSIGSRVLGKADPAFLLLTQIIKGEDWRKSRQRIMDFKPLADL